MMARPPALLIGGLLWLMTWSFAPFVRAADAITITGDGEESISIVVEKPMPEPVSQQLEQEFSLLQDGCTAGLVHSGLCSRKVVQNTIPCGFLSRNINQRAAQKSLDHYTTCCSAPLKHFAFGGRRAFSLCGVGARAWNVQLVREN